MIEQNGIKRIAIIGAGPGGMFIFKRLIETIQKNIEITIYEKKQQLGAGMPYSTDGANPEHVTNVSGNEIPELETSLSEWIHNAPVHYLEKFNININKFNDYKVIPRLLFGEYLTEQFRLLLKKAKSTNIPVTVCHQAVTDIADNTQQQTVTVHTNKNEPAVFNYVIICSGHRWPQKFEGIVHGYYDSPYPPSKLAVKINFPVAIRGASLTAVDAIRTLARANGCFSKDNNGDVIYHINNGSEGFKLVMHTRNGLLPAVRFHLDDSHLSKNSVLSKDDIEANRNKNEGFLSLDFVFEKNFKTPIREKNAVFYEKIKQMSIEEFVEFTMSLRESVDAFNLFEGEYAEAEKSIKRKESVYWKEMLAVLSFAMNYPAKYFSAEDMLRLQKVLMPLISLVIAFVPQSSVEELLALHKCGLLQLVAVGDESNVEPVGNNIGVVYNYTDSNGNSCAEYFKMFIDCIGQQHLSYKDLPFKSLVDKKTVTPAKIKFRSMAVGRKEKESGNKKIELIGNDYYLNVPGITINDCFQVVDEYGASNQRIYIMAVPYIGGYNPDYSGLDFGEAASKLIAEAIIAA